MKKKLRLYVITHNYRVIAISEYEDDITSFYIQNNYKSSLGYELKEIKDQSLCNDLLIIYEDTYITELVDNGYIRGYIRYCDEKYIYDTIYSIRKRMYDAINLLLNIEDYLTISKFKDIEMSINTSEMLVKHFGNLDITKIIKDYYSSNNLYEPLDDFTSFNIY